MCYKLIKAPFTLMQYGNYSTRVVVSKAIQHSAPPWTVWLSRPHLSCCNSHTALGALNITYCTILHYTVLYCTILYYITLYCTILHYTVLYYTILYYIALYCTVLYCTVLHCVVSILQQYYLKH